MIIIIDGVDLSGKTTAIEKIAKHFNSGFTIKNNYKPRKLVDSDRIYFQYWTILKTLRDEFSSDRLIILDRFFPSQAVYSILRGKDEMFSKDITALDNFCKNMDIIYIYLNTPLSVLEERYDKRGDEHITKNQLKELYNRYQIFFKHTQMKKIMIDTRIENWLEEVENFINETKNKLEEMKR